MSIKSNRNILKSGIYSFALLLLLLAYSCTKQQPLADQLRKKEKEKEESTTGQLLPVKIEIGKSVMELKYQEEPLLLTEISYPNGEVGKVLYTKTGYPFKFERYKNSKKIQYFIYALDAASKVSKIQNWEDKNGVFVLSQQYTLAYDKQYGINSIKKYDLASEPLGEELLTYSNLGNPQTITFIQKNISNEFSWTYDDKTAIFNQLPFVQVLFLGEENQDLSMGRSNPLSASSHKSPLENKTFSYKYNSSGYPVEITRKKGGSTITMKITYKPVKTG
ncbi:hypothetical protein [Pedobacter caeni]|uniref:YD repeat-containing protein n=1 Tax=Pedobacter caeni TaxID=288992 RepID=A0A1M5HCF2_9SPHI|nr:hypothetical protein [Pedobacter caeni]SHG13614.1 YD repeat-containing protein [Pedobacter caeni]